MAKNDPQHQCQQRSRTHGDSTSKHSMASVADADAASNSNSSTNKMTNDGTDKSEAAASFATASLATDSPDVLPKEEPGTPFFEAEQFDNKDDDDDQGGDHVEYEVKEEQTEGSTEEKKAGSSEDPSSSASAQAAPSESAITSNPTPSATKTKAKKTNGSSKTKRKKTQQQQRSNPFGSPKPAATSSSSRRKRKAATPDKISSSQKQKDEHSNDNSNSVETRSLKAAGLENGDTTGGGNPQQPTTAQNDSDTTGAAQPSTTVTNEDPVLRQSGKSKRNSARKRSPTEKVMEMEEEQRKQYPKRQRSPSLQFAGMDVSSEDEEGEKKPAKRSKTNKSAKRKVELEEIAEEIVEEEEPDQGGATLFNTTNPFDQLADDEQLQEIKRAVKRSNVPSPGSPGFIVHKTMDRLRRDSLTEDDEALVPPTMTTTKVQPIPACSNTLFSFPADTNLRILYHLTRAHLLNGKMVEALVVCHDVLKSSYAQVETVLPKARVKQSEYADDADLLVLREKIAGTWCLYAHLFLQITDTDMFFGVTDENNAKGNGLPLSREDFSHNVMEDRLWDHAIAILSLCKSCPLVGNHAAITLALSRLRSRRRERNRLRRFHSGEGPMKGTKSYFSKLVGTADHWRRNLGGAINICRGSLGRSNASRPPTKPTARFVAREGPFDGLEEILDLKTTAGHVSNILSEILKKNMKWNTCNPEENDASKATIAPAFLADVLEIPQKLQAGVRKGLSPTTKKKVKCKPLPYVYADSASARLICREMNCLSRLEQSISDFDGSSELRMITDPDHVECLGQNVSGVDGVAWGDFIFFQSMNIALVEEKGADNYKYYQKTPISAAEFFKHTGVESTWKKRFDIDGYAKFPLKLVFTNVEHTCSKCNSVVKEKQLESHACMGDGSEFVRDALQTPWVDLSSALNASDAPLDRGRGDAKSKSSKVLDFSCACRKCCAQSSLYDMVNVQESEKCYMLRGSAEEPTNSTGYETVAGDDVDGDGLYESVRDVVDTLLLGEHDDAAAKPDDIVEVVDDGPSKSKKARGDVGQHEQHVFEKPKTRMRFPKPQVNMNLKGLFEEAAGDDDNETVIAPPSQRYAALVAVRTAENNNAREESHRNAEEDEAIRKKNEKKVAGLSVDYPCRKCFKAGHSSEKDRDLHERLCRGHLGGSSVCLSENWPPLASNLSSAAEVPRQGMKRPLAEGPTPRKTHQRAGGSDGGEHLPTDTMASKRCKITKTDTSKGTGARNKQLKSLATSALGPLVSTSGQRSTRGTGKVEDTRRRSSRSNPSADQSDKDQSLALAKVPISEKTAMVGS